MNNPLDIIVAIKVIVYNHEPYLRDCLEGFVMQQTNFPFVAIVHDDASTDGSAAIIREYEKKFPNIIKPIFETENQYSKRDGSLGRIMNTAIDATGAKYVAMCEGDDYWIDPLKLQKQVDFLEANLDFGFIGTRCLIKKSDVLTSEIYPVPKIIDVDGVEQYGDVFESFALYGPVTRTCSLMYRNSLLVDEKNLSGDYYMQAILASKSKFARLSSESCVYRIHSSGVSNDKTHQGMLNYIRWYVDQRLQINRRFPEIHPFDEQELHDMLEYKKMQISILQFDYTSYLNSKKAIKTPAYKKKILYRLIIGKLSFYIISKLYCLKN